MEKIRDNRLIGIHVGARSFGQKDGARNRFAHIFLWSVLLLGLVSFLLWPQLLWASGGNDAAGVGFFGSSSILSPALRFFGLIHTSFYFFLHIVI